jgi:hypothetical protein
MRHLKPVGATILVVETGAVGETSGLTALVALRAAGTVEIGDVLVADIAEPVVVSGYSRPDPETGEPGPRTG